MTDFFVSYTHLDEDWAVWIAHALEGAGYSTTVQAWDFRPGSNFVLEMQRAAAGADRTVMVLSPDYLESQYASPEWAAAFASDPQGLERRLLPVMVRACRPSGLLAPIVQIRIAGLDEHAAREALLAGVDGKRAKPSRPPAFPGRPGHVTEAPFPGAATAPGRAPSQRVLPPLRQEPTDVERRRFSKGGFDGIKELFEANLQAASEQDARIETDFRLDAVTDFTAELFVDGTSRCTCRIWLGGMHSSDNICYSEGRLMSREACNEVISLARGQGELAFHAMMAMGAPRQARSYDTDRMTAAEVADYLWSKFTSALAR